MRRRRVAAASRQKAAIEPQVAERPEVLERVLSGAAPAPEEILGRFFARRSKHTQAAYKQDMAAFARFLGVSVHSAVGILFGCSHSDANALAEEWCSQMQASGLAPATQVRRLGTLRAFSRAARKAGVISWVLETDPPRAEAYRDTRGPLPEAVDKMFGVCEGSDLKSLRDRLVLSLLVILALRRTEVTVLKLKDYDREGRRLLVTGKGYRGAPKKKWVGLASEGLIKAIDVWIEAAGVTDPEAPLVHRLCNPGAGEPLRPKGVYMIVRRLASSAGVKNVWPHGLRHASITQGLDHHDMRTVQSFSRHKKVETVVRYDDNRRDLGGDVVRTLGKRFLGDG